SARISLYLAAETTDEQALTFAKSLAHSPDIAHIELIPKDQAMAEFRTFSGFGEVVEALGENPLPPVLMIRAHEERSRQAVEDLAANLRSLNEVEMATVDIAWMERLFALVDFSQRLIWMIAGLLGLTVLLIVGNTIRLDIHNRREEIEVVKLVGGTNSFIRRPFLYSGIWYGIVAGVLAFVLVEIARWTLHGPVRRMAESYGSNIAIDSIGFLGLVALILAGVLLGLAGSWLAVSYHVRRIEPA
ncbi:MAG: permease-like cell division protein FtsX, partial [Gammaproteobacteria bacterium]